MKSAQNTVHGDDFEGSAVWKKQTETSKNASQKNIEKSSKIDPKTDKKYKKYWNDQKMHKKNARKQFWVDFWVPGEAKKQVFWEENERHQKVKQKVVGAVASAGDAEGGKEGLDGWTGRDLARPWPIAGMGGRIEPAEPEPPPAH